MSKKTLEKDYIVPPLEGLWWAEDMETFVTREKSKWDWTMMILTPDWITKDIFADAVTQVRKAKDPAALDRVRLDHYHERLVLAEMHNELFPKNGFSKNGKHHEIYLGDPRRVEPEKLKTVLRQPVTIE